MFVALKFLFFLGKCVLIFDKFRGRFLRKSVDFWGDTPCLAIVFYFFRENSWKILPGGTRGPEGPWRGVLRGGTL